MNGVRCSNYIAKHATRTRMRCNMTLKNYFFHEFRSRLGHGHGKTRPGDAAYLWNSWVEILLTYLFHLFIRVTPNRHTCLIKGVLVCLFKGNVAPLFLPYLPYTFLLPTLPTFYIMSSLSWNSKYPEKKGYGRKEKRGRVG